MNTLTRFYFVFYVITTFILEKALALVELLLSLRIALELLGANPQTLMVRLLYEYTGVLIAPFASIFPNAVVGGFVIESTAVVAMVAYALAVFLAVNFLKLFA